MKALTSLLATAALSLPLLPGTGRGAAVSPAAPAVPQVLFDDFSYAQPEEMPANGWTVRTKPGWPGVKGATWRTSGVSFLDDPARPGNRVLRMTAFTDGTGQNTQQTQICHQRKYLGGTYAARVRFTDQPVAGPGGDQVVQSFYTISPLVAPMHPDYSEIDFEYLANGGWGETGPALFTTTWKTYSPEPNWKKDNIYDTRRGSLAGWHTLVVQVAAGKVNYFMDGKPLAEHGGRFYPRVLMSLNFNLWFTAEGAIKSTARREYQEDIDWVYFEADAVVAPADVDAKVETLRKDNVKFRDTVRPPVPALPCPCDT